jgi:dephospho-CoA kinase
MSAFRLGLTGSIGMGKSTTAGFFAEQGVPVWNADDAVHRLYREGGAAVSPVAALHPAALVGNAIDRGALKAWIARDPDALKRIEAVVHPLVAMDRNRFLADATAHIVLLDIPLLFETGAEASLDATLVVTAPSALQRRRVLARPGMTEEIFDTILARQLPDAEKRARATHIIETLSLASVRACVIAIIDYIRSSPVA